MSDPTTLADPADPGQSRPEADAPRVITAADLEQLTPNERAAVVNDRAVTNPDELDPALVDRVRAQGRELLDNRHGPVRGKVCGVEGCTRPTVARGWCGAHYQRWRAGRPVEGPIRPRTRRSGACAVQGCERPAQARGWCRSHYARWRRTGDVQPHRAVTGHEGPPVCTCPAPTVTGWGECTTCRRPVAACMSPGHQARAHQQWPQTVGQIIVAARDGDPAAMDYRVRLLEVPSQPDAVGEVSECG